VADEAEGEPARGLEHDVPVLGTGHDARAGPLGVDGRGGGVVDVQVEMDPGGAVVELPHAQEVVAVGRQQRRELVVLASRGDRS